MKKKMSFLTLAVLLCVFCCPVVAEQKPQEEHLDNSLISQPNPELSQVKEIYVAIIAPAGEPNAMPNTWQEVKDEIKDRLQKAGIKITNGQGQYSGRTASGTAELKIHIYTLDVKELQNCVFYVQTAASRSVYIPGHSRTRITCDVWKTEPAMQIVPIAQMSEAIKKAAFEQADAFIGAYLVANEKSKESEDSTGIKQRQTVRPAAKQGIAEYRYVASKNSKVFHKADCESAQSIKSENLIVYRSREEAIQAGKRPCKRCKP